MKIFNKATIFTLTFLLITLTAVCQNVYIPDVNFKTELLNTLTVNSNGDSEIQVTEAAVADTIWVNSQDISDLTGIEAFTGLKVLYCSYNNLTTLNLTANTSLLQLDCGSNPLTSLNVSGISSLQYIWCMNTQVTSLNLSTNSSLISIECAYNPSLSYLNVKNGNNVNVQSFKAYSNISLHCIIVDDVTWANQHWGNTNHIDLGMMFSENCNVGIADEITNTVSISPNPATTEITVNSYSPAYLKLCNAVGQTVAESKSNKLYVGNLSQGLYVLQLFDANGQQVKTE